MSDSDKAVPVDVDGEFIDRICACLHNADFAALLGAGSRRERADAGERVIAALLKAGQISEDEVPDLRQISNMTSPEVLQMSVDSIMQTALALLPSESRPSANAFHLRGAYLASYNARVLRTPSGKPLVVFDQGVFTFSRMASRSARLLAVRPDGFLHGVVLWASTVRSIAFADPIALEVAMKFYKDGEKLVDDTVFMGALSENSALFVLLHEIGHVMLRHLQLAAFGEQELGGERALLYEVRRDRELQADAFALSALLGSRPYSAEGALLMMKLLEQVDTVIGRDGSGTDSHPAWAARSDQLLALADSDDVRNLAHVLKYLNEMTLSIVLDPELGGVIRRNDIERD